MRLNKMYKHIQTYSINRAFKLIGITLLISLFFMAPIVNVLVSYTDLIPKDSLEKVMSNTMEEEEGEDDLEIEDWEETKYLTVDFISSKLDVENFFNNEFKNNNQSLFDPDLFTPPPKYYFS